MTTPPRVWGEHQLGVFDFVRTDTRSAVVLAVAGSGKTSTLVEACRHVPAGKSILVLTFAAKVRMELQQKVPRGIPVHTFHSFGDSIIKNHYQEPPYNAEKDWMNAKASIPPDFWFGYAEKLVSLLDKAKMCLAYNQSDVMELAKKYDCDGLPAFDDDQWYGFFKEAIDVCMSTPYERCFSEMNWTPIVHNMSIPQFDLILIDEAQDTNIVQLELVMRALKPGGRIIAFGDERQAIFEFRGGGQDSIARIIERTDAVRLPLSITYRCPRSVATIARRIFPIISPAAGAAEGTVRNVSSVEMFLEARPGDVILSRSNAPLVEHTLDFLRENRPAIMSGKDITKDLVRLVNRSNCSDIDKFLDWLARYELKERAALRKTGRENRLDSLMEKIKTITALTTDLDTVAQLKDRITTLFLNLEESAVGEDTILLSSTHKAKGMEWKRVWLLCDTYRPGKSDEEDNIVYVAVTRSMESLFLVDANLSKSGFWTGGAKDSWNETAIDSADARGSYYGANRHAKIDAMVETIANKRKRQLPF